MLHANVDREQVIIYRTRFILYRFHESALLLTIVYIHTRNYCILFSDNLFQATSGSVIYVLCHVTSMADFPGQV